MNGSRLIIKIDKQFKVVSALMIGIFLMLLPIYKLTCSAYSYLPYYSYTGISIERLSVALLLLAFFLIYSSFIRNEFLKIVYYISTVLLFVGELANYVVDNNAGLSMIVAISVFLLGFKLIDGENIIIRVTTTNARKNTNLLLIISIILTIPFLRYISDINILNLFLIDVYETRTAFRDMGGSFLNYIFGPLSRVLLPVLIISSFENKRKVSAIIGIVLLAYLFLCGALKSVLFGLLCILFFYKGDYENKTKRFIILIFVLEIAALALFRITGGYNPLLDYIRRIFIIPPRFNNYYIDYFSSNLTHYGHSGFAFIKDLRFSDIDISHFVGRYVMGTGTNANVGVFTEGIYSFGIIGGLVYLIVPLLIVWYFKVVSFNKDYFGLIFVYLYIMNTSILSTLLLTHGLLFFMILSYYFLRDKRFVSNIETP